MSIAECRNTLRARERIGRIVDRADVLHGPEGGHVGDVRGMLRILEQSLNECHAEVRAWSVLVGRIEERRQRLRRQIYLTVQARAKTFLAQQQLWREHAQRSQLQLRFVAKRFSAQRCLLELRTDRVTRLQKQFCFACQLGNQELVRRFIDKGAHKDSVAILDIDFYKYTATTALHAAARQGHMEIVRFLCELRADPEALSLDVSGWNRTALCSAAKAGQYSVVQLLVEFRADVNCARCDWEHPLKHVSGNGDVAMVKLLLGLAADVNFIHYEDAEYKTALGFAAMMGKAEVVYLLCQSSADVNFDFPLHAAAGEGHAAVAKILCEFRADVNRRDSPYRKEGSPLTDALASKHVDVVEVLLNAGAATSRDLRSRDKKIAALLREVIKRRWRGPMNTPDEWI